MSFYGCCDFHVLLFVLLEQISCVFSLHVAAARGQTDCLAVLLAHGVDLSIADAAGTTDGPARLRVTGRDV